MLTQTEKFGKFLKSSQQTIISILIRFYRFRFISENFEYLAESFIYSDFKNSQVVVIDHYIDKEENAPYFIISFKQALLTVLQSSISLLQPLFAYKPKITICFLSNCKEIFDQNIQIQYNEIPYDSAFRSEIFNFSQKINRQITDDNQVDKFLKIVGPCLYGHLIKESYAKLNYNVNLKSESYRYDTFSMDYNKKCFHKKVWNDDEYIELRQIGVGSEFTISLVYIIENKELFALKKPRIQSEEIEKLVDREIENYLSIEHPLFPKFCGTVFINNKIKGFMIEFIYGRMLREFQEIQLDERDKIFIIFELIMAIYYLHTKKNFILRDLKPNNIMIDKLKTVVIIDFDRMVETSHFLENSDFTKDIGTDFSAPEIQIKCSKKSDIYSFGKIIYFLMKEKNERNEFIIKNSFINNIYKRCTNADPNVRPDITEIYYSYYKTFEDLILYKSLQSVFQAQFISNEIINIRDIISKDSSLSVRCLLLTNQGNPKQFADFGAAFLFGKNVPQDINKAIECFSIAAEMNDINSICNLAQIYLDNIHVPRDINKTIFYYTKAAQLNFSPAQAFLGSLYFYGKYVSKDITKSISYLTQAAENNDKNSQFLLGTIYYKGKDANFDISKAIYFYSKAAKQNHSMAQYYLGEIYFNGKYIQVDIAKAISFFEQAAQNNNAEAQFKLGEIYYHGMYVNIDITKSIYYYKHAADQNHPVAQFKLGLIYYDGKENVHDVIKGIDYYTKSAEQNYPQALFNLGRIYYEGKYIKVDIEKSIHYYSLASDQDYGIAQFNLGLIYYENKYVNRDTDKAIHYIELAAKHNLPAALIQLGRIYYDGLFVTRDVSRAIYYFSKAADQNDAQAQLYLALMYITDDTNKDIQKAIHYFKLAAEQNNSFAQLNLGIIYFEGKYVKRDVPKSIFYLQQSALQNNKHALFKLGILYFEGIHVVYDIKKVIEYFTKASYLDEPLAQFFLGMFYLEGKFIKQDVNKGLHFLVLASNNNLHFANFVLGCLYHEGIYLKYDIQKAIHFYKEASSFKNEKAKNNLGILYKNGVKDNVEKKIGDAIVYFNESIQQSKDAVSMYNLAHIYLYDKNLFKENIDKILKLLIMSSNKGFFPSKILLCLALINKFGFNFDAIKNELDVHSIHLFDNIYKVMKNHHLDDQEMFDKVYEDYKNVDFLYNYSGDPIFSRIKKTSQNININNIKVINNLFYEGFEISI